MTWIILTLSATIFQTFRNSFAKKLSGHLSPLSVSFCRFLYGLPISSLAMLIAWVVLGDVGNVSLSFYLWVTVFSIAQIAANALLIALFSYKNFAVSITYSKTEGMFTALLAVFVLGEFLPVEGWLGIALAFVGLFVASLAQKRVRLNAILGSFAETSTLLGLASGVLFAIATVCIKHAFSFIDTEQPLMRPIYSLFVAQVIQVLILLPYLLIRKRWQLKYIITQPFYPSIVGLFSGLGSMCWFLAFSIAFVGYVKTLGQLEFLLSVLVSVFYFKEKVTRNEIFGMLLMVVGTLLLIW